LNLPSSLPGAAQIFVDQFGGIPMGLLNGTSFAHYTGPWTNDAASTDRSVAQGWSGSAQLTAFSGCNVGKVTMVWDMSMWNGGNYAGAVKTTTDLFFQKLALWM